MSQRGLTLHPVKTRLVDLRRGKESFVFLGCTIRKKRSIQRNPRWHFMQRWPSPKATKKLRDRVREFNQQAAKREGCEADHRGTDARASRLAELFPDGKCRPGVQQDGRVCDEESTPLAVPAGRATTQQTRAIHRRSAHGMGLLMGTVKYPAQATRRRSSLSRVPENGMHGLKGEIRNGLM